MSNVELAKYFDLIPIMVEIQLLKEPRIYASICDVCDHARFIHGAYHSDYSVGIRNDYCLVEDCECGQFTAPTKPRSPFTEEAVRVHLCLQIVVLQNHLDKIDENGGWDWARLCPHCNQMQYNRHVIDMLNEYRNDLHRVSEIRDEWENASRCEETERASSMPLKNSKSCTMFRCLKCFRYIFPDDEVAKHGDGFVHKVCLSTKNLLKYTSEHYQSQD